MFLLKEQEFSLLLLDESEERPSSSDFTSCCLT